MEYFEIQYFEKPSTIVFTEEDAYKACLEEEDTFAGELDKVVKFEQLGKKPDPDTDEVVETIWTAEEGFLNDPDFLDESINEFELDFEDQPTIAGSDISEYSWDEEDLTEATSISDIKAELNRTLDSFTEEADSKFILEEPTDELEEADCKVYDAITHPDDDMKELKEDVAKIKDIPSLSKEELNRLSKSFGEVFIYKDEPEDEFRICYTKPDGNGSDPVDYLEIKDFTRDNLNKIFDEINKVLKDRYNVYLDFDMYIVPAINQFIDVIKNHSDDYEEGQFEYTPYEVSAIGCLRSADDDSLIANKLHESSKNSKCCPDCGKEICECGNTKLVEEDAKETETPVFDIDYAIADIMDLITKYPYRVTPKNLEIIKKTDDLLKLEITIELDGGEFDYDYDWGYDFHTGEKEGDGVFTYKGKLENAAEDILDDIMTEDLDENYDIKVADVYLNTDNLYVDEYSDGIAINGEAVLTITVEIRPKK